MVDLERWVWGVIYDDGTELHQFMADGTFHRLAEIDQKRVRLWVLYKPSNPNQRIDIIIPKDEGVRLIHKYKNTRPYYLNTFVRTYMFGYRTGKNESDYRYHFNFILPDDRIVQSTFENIDLVQFKLTEPTD